MKSHAVLGWNSNNVYDFGGPRESRFPYWAEGKPASDQAPSSFDGKTTMYFCDSDEAAQGLAKYLAGKYANIQWMVVKTTDVYQSTPGPVKQGKLTASGLLPV